MGEPLPMGPFRCIVADPPWQFATFSAKGRDRCPDARKTNARGNFVDGLNNSPARHYETMPLQDIMDLRVSDVAADDCLLLLWAVDPMIPQAIEVGRAWGFQFKTVGFYWAKERRVTSKRGEGVEDAIKRAFPMGTGYWTRANPESCLLFTRGSPKRLAANVRKLIVAPRREHSRKPDEFYAETERLIAGPRLELFARQPRAGWTVWGNQTDKFSEAA